MRRIVDGTTDRVDERRGHQDEQSADLILGTLITEEPANKRQIS